MSQIKLEVEQSQTTGEYQLVLNMFGLDKKDANKAYTVLQNNETLTMARIVSETEYRVIVLNYRKPSKAELIGVRMKVTKLLKDAGFSIG